MLKCFYFLKDSAQATFEGIRNSVYTNLYRIPQNFALLYLKARGVAGVRVGEPSCPRHPPTVSAADFTELYDLCLARGLKAHIIFNHAAGRQTLTVTCHLPLPAVTTAATGKSRRCHCLCRRRSRAAIAVLNCPARVVPTTLAAPTAPSPTQTQPPLPSPDIIWPPAKRTRKR